MTVAVEKIDQLARKLRVITLKNSHGTTAEILNFGARLKSLFIPSKLGLQNVVLGYRSPSDYLTDPYYTGATTGRYANRIRNACFGWFDEKVSLDANEGRHHLHGGTRGFDRQFWQVKKATEQSVTLGYHSPDRDQGYAGAIDVSVTYELNDDNSLTILHTAHASKPTLIGLSNHSYFNLHQGHGHAHDQKLQVLADTFLPVTSDKIPTGEIKHVEGTAFDFRASRALSELTPACADQPTALAGFDHTLVKRSTGNKPSLAAELRSDISGIGMKLFTSYPGVHLYGGQHLRRPFSSHAGICLEPQYFPDAPNHAHFATPSAGADQIYEEVIRLVFHTE